ncbi:MAG: cytochrome b/b6 domain-containing protein [Candidatus Thiodiazotropha sp.]|jgi:thiosulfate reductase cytochrome b subunit
MAVCTIRIFSLFERIWHWSQALSIFILIFTGLAIHGTHDLIDFGLAVTIHTIVALALLVLWAFATFWLFTTGELRHFIPTMTPTCRSTLLSVARYYAYGIFKGEHHPYEKTMLRKHNPLQGVSYLTLKIVVFPAIWISGIAYLLESVGLVDLSAILGVGLVAIIHTAAAVVIIMFVILHIYLLTTGHSFKAHLMPMINGKDEVDLTKDQYDYLLVNEPKRLDID